MHEKTSEHRAIVEWTRDTAPSDFTRSRYSRAHTWRFDGGVVVPASASPHVVRAPFSDPAGVDPEEAFVASLASCHMLSFLYVAAKAGHVVESYADDAVGTLEKNEQGRLAITRVTLRPKVTFASAIDTAGVRALHDAAHLECFIAASVRTAITID